MNENLLSPDVARECIHEFFTRLVGSRGTLNLRGYIKDEDLHTSKGEFKYLIVDAYFQVLVEATGKDKIVLKDEGQAGTPC